MAEFDRSALEQIIIRNCKKLKNGRRDICTIYRNYEELDALITYLAEPFKGKADYVAGPEPLGFMVGILVAQKLGVGFIPIRDGKIAVLSDDDVIRASYIDHEDNPRMLQVRKSNLPEKSRILLVDDWVETAATMNAALAILEQADIDVVGMASLGTSMNAATEKYISTGKLRYIYCK